MIEKPEFKILFHFKTYFIFLENLCPKDWLKGNSVLYRRSRRVLMIFPVCFTFLHNSTVPWTDVATFRVRCTNRPSLMVTPLVPPGEQARP